jgi:hypothetical protein
MVYIWYIYPLIYLYSRPKLTQEYYNQLLSRTPICHFDGRGEEEENKWKHYTND